MTKAPHHVESARQAGKSVLSVGGWSAADVIADRVGDFLSEWACSGESPTSGADRLLAEVLRHELLFEAIREVRKPAGELLDHG